MKKIPGCMLISAAVVGCVLVSGCETSDYTDNVTTGCVDETGEIAETDYNIIDHLQKFLLELGRGFSFVARQKKISFDGRHFYIDLVFYNYILKCFVLIDLAEYYSDDLSKKSKENSDTYNAPFAKDGFLETDSL